jgi:hypothetical protein
VRATLVLALVVAAGSTSWADGRGSATTAVRVKGAGVRLAMAPRTPPAPRVPLGAAIGVRVKIGAGTGVRVALGAPSVASPASDAWMRHAAATDARRRTWSRVARIAARLVPWRAR